MQERGNPSLAKTLVFALFIVYLMVILRDAWVGDDVFITLRTVKQWVMRGELGWNPHERVQAYTHPLWMMLLAAGYAITREPYYTTLVLSVLCSGAAIGVVIGKSQQRLGSVLFLALLINSRAFVDYSTSGLENPLTHLLCASTFVFYTRPNFALAQTRRWPEHGRRVLLVSFLTALAMVNRLDTVLLVAPMAAWTAVEALRAGLKLRTAIFAVLIGALPILAWEAFSLVYYGSLVPNTALAKLNTQIPSGELFFQGLNYLYESLTADHLTLVAILGGLSLPLATGQARNFAVVAGSALYTLYLLKIGGDFMSGRFLTPPFFLTAALLTQVRGLTPGITAGVAAMATLLNLSSPRTTIPLGPPQAPFGRIDHRGIADERGFYMNGAGLNRMNRHNDAPHRSSRYDGENMDPKKVHVRGALGYVGFHASLDTYIVDHWALTDALVARLPAIYHPKWRIGHFSRALPAGYTETIEHQEDRLHNRHIAQYYSHLQRITKGPLWSKERWASIWKLQSGQLDHLIAKPFFRYHGALVAMAEDMRKAPRKGNAPREFRNSGIFIDYRKMMHDAVIVLDLDADDDYRLLYERHGRIIGEHELPRVVPRPSNGAPGVRVVHVAEDILKKGYEAVRVVPVRGHPPYRIWHMHSAKDAEAEKLLSEKLETQIAREQAEREKAEREKAELERLKPKPGDRIEDEL